MWTVWWNWLTEVTSVVSDYIAGYRVFCCGSLVVITLWEGGCGDSHTFIYFNINIISHILTFNIQHIAMGKLFNGKLNTVPRCAGCLSLSLSIQIKFHSGFIDRLNCLGQIKIFNMNCRFTNPSDWCIASDHLHHHFEHLQDHHPHCIFIKWGPQTESCIGPPKS